MGKRWSDTGATSNRIADVVSRRRWQLLAIAVLALAWALAALRAIREPMLIGDELVHAAQIHDFLHGHFRVLPTLTNIPGYHLLVAGLLALAGHDTLAAMRVVNMGFDLACIGMFYLLRRGVDRRHAARATAQFAFFPLLYPYGFLVYTDILSVALVLAALWATRGGRHVLSGGILLLALLVRQNDVVWAGFLASFALWPLLQETDWRPWRAGYRMLAIAWPYLAVVVLFVVYWAWNGTIVFSKPEALIHPDMSFHWGNPFFLLFVAGVLMPLQLIGGLRWFGREACRRYWPWLLPVIVLLVYVTGFKVDNFFNHVSPDYFIHNAVLVAVDGPRWAWLGFGLVATVAACALAGTRFVLPQAWVLFPFAAFYLSASWLIDGRYTLIPLALWLALRRQDGNVVERTTLAGWVVLAQYLALGMSARHFML